MPSGEVNVAMAAAIQCPKVGQSEHPMTCSRHDVMQRLLPFNPAIPTKSIISYLSFNDEKYSCYINSYSLRIDGMFESKKNGTGAMEDHVQQNFNSKRTSASLAC